METSAHAQTIAVLGAGAWGTALAMQLARNGRRALLWGRRRKWLEDMVLRRRNDHYLPAVTFPERLEPQWDLNAVLAQTSMLVLAVPSQAFRPILREVAVNAHEELCLLWATKGLETSSGKLLHQVVDEELGAGTARGLLSGPSFAAEVARGLPTAVTIAAHDISFARQAASWFHGDTFRVYTSLDVVGVELGGALKNVLAIAAGISDGLGFGANARAALVTRGLYEIMRLSECAGAQRETLMGLSGLGDLVLTCTDDQSRNRRLGLALGRGRSVKAAVREAGQTVEGIATASVVVQVARDHQAEMPICEQVYRVLFEGLDPSAAVNELLHRERKMEAI
ncbi:MAG TPA: NAD(P)H-dependent glycerol-3-phosphate dehydrogenase [Gammaproteobacteria bacterium]|nr:NAD(P)H-dependent glycerol-3-phosphate dehydrogenase [Gammaproteobacteria bacterium]